MLGRFQNSSVPVLNFSSHSVPVPAGSTKSIPYGSGFKEFGFSVLTILTFWPIVLNCSCSYGLSNLEFQSYLSVKSNIPCQNRAIFGFFD